MYYPIVIHQELDSCYGVTVPDIEGCFSAGESLEDSIEQAKEAIDFHLESLADDGEEIPSPKDIKFHQKNNDYNCGTWALVQIDASHYLGKAQREITTKDTKVEAEQARDGYAKKFGLKV